MKILMTGATGLVGRELGLVLAEQGHEIFVVTRDQAKASQTLPFACQCIQADLQKEVLSEEVVQNIEAVIHLAGASLGEGRWTQERKKEIYESRIFSTRHLLASFKRQVPKVFISASAIGFYGDRKDEVLTEKSLRGEGFLSQVCWDWEKTLEDEVLRESSPWKSTRFCRARFGFILSASAPALQKMLTPFRLGIGGPLGSGEQWVSWVHLQDVVKSLVFALENEKVAGAFNVVSPEAVTQRHLSELLAAQMNKKLWPAVPAIILKLILGEMADLILSSQRVLPEKLLSWGFQFQYKDLNKVVAEICQKPEAVTP